MQLSPPFTHLLTLSYLSLFFLLGTALASPASHSNRKDHKYILHESRSAPPPLWNRLQRYRPPTIPTDTSTSTSTTPPAHLIPLKLGLKQPNLDQISTLLHDVSDPTSPNYGNWWSAEQVRDTFKPSEEAVKAVGEWLVSEGLGKWGKGGEVQADNAPRGDSDDGGSGYEQAGIGSVMRIAPSRGWIQVDVTVEQLERLLKTEYYVWRHNGTGDEHIACTEYHLPERISPHIDLITPSIHFDTVLKKRPSSHSTQLAKKIGQPGHGIMPKTTGTIHPSSIWTHDLEKCDEAITPPCLRALYGIQWRPMMGHMNSIAIVEYTPQAYVQADLDMFARNFSGHLHGKSPRLVSIDGGIVQDIQQDYSYNGESNLDLQYAMHLVNSPGEEAKQEVLLYQVGDLPQGATFNNLLDAIDGSYCTFRGGDDPVQDGWYPDDYPGGYQNCGIIKPANVISTSYGYNEADLSLFYAARQCAEYAKLGLMGVTVVYSSGDSGVAGNGDYCLNSDGMQSEEGTIFNPGFPSTCPYVTSVGATQMNPGSKVTDKESACSQVIRSGGGFSNYFPMPLYQRKHVDKWFRRYKPVGEMFDGLWNASGVSRAYPDISANGANYMVAVNGMYHNIFGTSASAPVVASVFTLINDARIAVGKKPVGFVNPVLYSDMFHGALNDIVSGSNEGCGSPGFSAVPGWDPVTGLGTPSFLRMLTNWMALP